jgi:beta-hydroxylase
MSAAASPNDNNDRTGAINHLFKYVNAIRDAGQKLKKESKTILFD